MTTHIQIDPDTWQTKKDNEDQGEIHPCNDPMPEQCMCKGACSCHWVMRPITTHTTEPIHIKNAMLDLCENWESVASEFRERAAKSQTANGKPNPEVCRSIAVGLEQCARDVRKIMGERMTQPDTEPAGPPAPDSGSMAHYAFPNDKV